MTDINDWPGHPDGDPDCECCLGDGLQADGETPCPGKVRVQLRENRINGGGDDVG